MNRIKILLVLLLLCVTIQSNGEPPVPIVNKTVEVNSISSTEAAQIYTGKSQRWANGEIINVIILPKESSSSREFIYFYLGMTPSQFYESVRISIKVRKNKNIKIVKDEQELIRMVIETDNSIGYADGYILTHLNYDMFVKKLIISQ